MNKLENNNIFLNFLSLRKIMNETILNDSIFGNFIYQNYREIVTNADFINMLRIDI